MKELADSAGSVETSMVKADKHLKHMRTCLQTAKYLQKSQHTSDGCWFLPGCWYKEVVLVCGGVWQDLLGAVWVTILASGGNRVSGLPQNYDFNLSSIPRTQKKTDLMLAKMSSCCPEQCFHQSAL